MNPERVLDWVIAILVILFLVIPIIGSYLAKNKPRTTPVKQSMPIKPPEFKQSVKSKEQKHILKSDVKKSDQKKDLSLLKYGSLKDAVILSEILRRPYSEDE